VVFRVSLIIFRYIFKQIAIFYIKFDGLCRNGSISFINVYFSRASSFFIESHLWFDVYVFLIQGDTNVQRRNLWGLLLIEELLEKASIFELLFRQKFKNSLQIGFFSKPLEN